MPDPRYLTPREFCARTRPSEATLRRRLKDGSIPFLQPGGPRTRLLVPADALERPAAATDADPPGPPGGGPAPAIPGPPPRWRAARRTTT